MMFRGVVALGGALVSLVALVATPVMAQTASAEVAAPMDLPAVTQDQVVAACTAAETSEARCKAMIAAYFTYLERAGASDVGLESFIAELVVALAEVEVSAQVKQVVVAAIKDIGLNYATGEQSTAILAIAETVETGQPMRTGALSASGA